MEITVAELMEKLAAYNPTATIQVIANHLPQDFSLCYGSSEGCTKETCETVSLYIDHLNGVDNSPRGFWQVPPPPVPPSNRKLKEGEEPPQPNKQ